MLGQWNIGLSSACCGDDKGGAAGRCSPWHNDEQTGGIRIGGYLDLMCWRQ